LLIAVEFSRFWMVLSLEMHVF